MIYYVNGNLMKADDMALVNTVNTVGVMGKGIALQFKENFPQNYIAYRDACKSGSIDIGKLLVYREMTLHGEKLIVNFPTKREWRNSSKYEYIEKGLVDLIRVIKQFDIKSISIPPLGCGNGGLDWEVVRQMIDRYLSPLDDVEIHVYQPSLLVKDVLRNDNGVANVSLTPARALILYAMFYYESLGESSSLFVANKLAYFMKRLRIKEFDRLNFKAHHYGPYAVGVGHMLYSLNGKYISGLEQNDAKAFEPLSLDYSRKGEISDFVRNRLDVDQIRKLKLLIRLISGFESAFSLEVLASVDYIREVNPDYTIDQVKVAIENWSNRKKDLFKIRYIKIAYDHLDKFGNMSFK